MVEMAKKRAEFDKIVNSTADEGKFRLTEHLIGIDGLIAVWIANLLVFAEEALKLLTLIIQVRSSD